MTRQQLSREHHRILAVLVIVFLLAGSSLHLDAAASSRSATIGPPEDGVIARVYYGGPEDLAHLAGMLDIWEVNHGQGYLVTPLSPDVRDDLEMSGHRVEIDRVKTERYSQPTGRLPSQTGGIPGFPCYRTVEETYAAMETLVMAHPQLAEWIDIGDTWDKITPGGAPGYDLFVLKLSNRNTSGPKARFFLMAAIHAREYTSAEMAARFAEHLVDRYGIDPDVTWLLDYQEVHIFLMANPDGRKWAEDGYYQRKNTNSGNGGDCSVPPSLFDHFGTDLNRNSPFHWGGASADPCDQVYQGPSASSEPETVAMQNYVLSIFADQRGPGDNDPAPADTTGLFITLHSYGRYALYPWGWTTGDAPNRTALRTLGGKFGYYNGYRVCQSGDFECLYPTTGASDDWAYGELGIPAYTFEMGTDFFETCSAFVNTIVPANMQALLYAARAARRPYQAPAGPDTLQISTTSGGLPPGEPVVLSAVADDTRYAFGGYGTEPSQDIIAARYTVDSPSWVSGAVAYPMAAADGLYDSTVETVTATLDLTGLAPGRHLLFVESQDAAGNWGVPSATFLTVVAPHMLYLPLVAAVPVP